MLPIGEKVGIDLSTRNFRLSSFFGGKDVSKNWDRLVFKFGLD